MCGRVIVDYDENMDVAAGPELAAWLTARPDAYAPSWNVKPTQDIPVALTDHKTGEKLLRYAYWSLVPVWAKEMKLRFPTFNARSETVTEKASFKSQVKSRRCVIPVSGFYEWTGPRSSRTPHAIFGPRPILPMAGLYSWWHEPEASDGEGWRLTATILTRTSAGAMTDLHDRMPIFLADDLVSDWLDPDTEGDQLLVDAVSEASIPISEQLREYAVRPLRGDGPELLLPA